MKQLFRYMLSFAAAALLCTACSDNDSTNAPIEEPLPEGCGRLRLNVTTAETAPTRATTGEWLEGTADERAIKSYHILVCEDRTVAGVTTTAIVDDIAGNVLSEDSHVTEKNYYLSEFTAQSKGISGGTYNYTFYALVNFTKTMIEQAGLPLTDDGKITDTTLPDGFETKAIQLSNSATVAGIGGKEGGIPMTGKLGPLSVKITAGNTTEIADPLVLWRMMAKIELDFFNQTGKPYIVEGVEIFPLHSSGTYLLNQLTDPLTNTNTEGGVKEYYKITDSATSPPIDGSWTDDPKTLTIGQYLWNYTMVNISGASTNKGPWNIDSYSKNISAVTEYYILSDDGTESLTEWTSFVPTIPVGDTRKLWKKTVITYSDATTKECDAHELCTLSMLPGLLPNPDMTTAYNVTPAPSLFVGKDATSVATSVAMSVYVNETNNSATAISNQYSLRLKIKRAMNEETTEGDKDDPSKWDVDEIRLGFTTPYTDGSTGHDGFNVIRRNDWIKIPVYITNWEFRVEAIPFVPIGGYPAIVISSTDATQITVATGGYLILRPFVRKLTDPPITWLPLTDTRVTDEPTELTPMGATGMVTTPFKQVGDDYIGELSSAITWKGKSVTFPLTLKLDGNIYTYYFTIKRAD